MVNNIIEKDVISLYLSGKSMRKIADEYGTNHKVISEILKTNNIETRKPKNNRGLRKFDSAIELNYNNMATHLRFEVSMDWFMQYEDYNKIKLLNNVISNRSGRWNVSTEWYKEYIQTFYYDTQFNLIYKKWIDSGNIMYKKPSIDHIIPISKGGTNQLTNLQFLSWFENRCKNDISQNQWDLIKSNITEFFI